MRVLILPSDPERGWVRLNDTLWGWWKQERNDPFQGGATSFSFSHSAAPEAVVSYDQYHLSSDPNVWKQYMALTRGGELDAGRGSVVAGGRGGRGTFFLLNMVGRVWVRLVRYAKIIERFGVHGPFQISVALVQTEGSTIGQFREGWSESGTATWDGWPICGEENVLLSKRWTSGPTGKVRPTGTGARRPDVDRLGVDAAVLRCCVRLAGGALRRSGVRKLIAQGNRDEAARGDWPTGNQVGD